MAVAFAPDCYFPGTELSCYYLQSRYYDPEVGRFINADSQTDIGSGFIGYNLYSYVANDPINHSDPSGHGLIKRLVKGIFDELKEGKNAVQNCWRKVVHGTTSKGVTVLGALGAAGTVSLGIAYDSAGNIGLVGTAGGGGGTPSFSVCGYYTKTNAPDIFKLSGVSTQYGGSVDAGVSLGAEYTRFYDSDTNNPYNGVTLAAGVGVAIFGVPIPFEMHADATYSHVIADINIFEAFDKVYDAVMDW